MRLLSFPVALAAMATAFPAHPEKPPNRPTVENLYLVTDCALQRDPRAFDRALSLPPGDDTPAASWNVGAVIHCIVPERHIAPERPILTTTYAARGIIAERLLYRDFASVGAAPRSHAVPVFAPVTRDYLGRTGERFRRMLAALDMTSCVARREPAKVYAFFRTERASASERAAMVELTPAISACLVEGQTFDMAPPLFRAFLAEGAYRVAAGQPSVYETSP